MTAYGYHDVVGYKKGGGGRAPIEASDTARSISYARVLDILSEGDIEGPVNGLKSVLLDGTPLAADDGTINFPGRRSSSAPARRTKVTFRGFLRSRTRSA